MTLWIVGALTALVVIWLWRRARGNTAQNAMAEARPWFEMLGLDFDSARFNVHRDAPVRHPGAVTLVGMAERGGRPQGFAVEVLPGSGVVAGEFISRQASMRGRSLAMQLQMMEHPIPLIDALLAIPDGNTPPT